MSRWLLPALLCGLTALVACFPMRWAAALAMPDEVKIIAPELDIRGTIWQGSVSGLPIFGAANLDISPLARRVNFNSGEGRNYLSGQLSPSSANNIDLRLDLAEVPFRDGRLQGLRGDVSVEIVEARLEGQSCLSAKGMARTDVLQRNGGNIQWTGPELTGPIRCENGALVADLSGQDAQQSISATLRILPDGNYAADISVRTSRQEADAVLPLFGFSRSGQNFVLTEQGKWR